MKRMNIILVAVCLLPSALLAQKTFTITGKVGNLNPPAKVYLYYIDGSNQITDSTEIKKGKFKFQGTVKEPSSASLSVRRASETDVKRLHDYFGFYLENSNIQITASDSIKHATITGSQVSKDNEDLQAELKPVMSAMDGLRKRWTGVKSKGPDDEAYNKAADSLKSLMASVKDIYAKFIDSHRTSYMGLVAFQRVAFEYNFDPAVVEGSFNKFPEELRTTALGRKISEKIEVARKSQVGAVLEDFTQNDVNDKPVRLSDFRGKYVFVDFWASWCAPCRAENPHVLAAYEKLKDENFVIIGISLDDSKKSWLNAVEKDGMPWIQVSDLKGWKNEVALRFGISAIPQNVLIDPKGVVVGKNLRGDNLYDQLKALIK